MYNISNNTYCSDISETLKYGYYNHAHTVNISLLFLPPLFSLWEPTNLSSYCNVKGWVLHSQILGWKLWLGQVQFREIHIVYNKISIGFSRTEISLVFDKVRISNSHCALSKKMRPRIVVLIMSGLWYQIHQERLAGDSDSWVKYCLMQKPLW